ncbi:MAG: tetratricopeptide repeat protein [Candidatus Eisenbacteria bacterium]|nr:tetratricopeptide repeat protein [Candidatus Eisenbacteria bacterium]
MKKPTLRLDIVLVVAALVVFGLTSGAPVLSYGALVDEGPALGGGGTGASFQAGGATFSNEAATGSTGKDAGIPGGKAAGGSGSAALDYAEKLIREGMLDVGENELLRFMETEPSPALRQRGALLLGDIKFSQSKLVEAATRYLRAYEANPQGEGACDALYKAGQCSLLSYNYEQAILIFRKVVKLFPDCAQSCPAMTALGRAFLGSGDYEEAARTFEQALVACGGAEKNAELLYWLGKAETQINRDRAREIFQDLRRAHPGTEPAFNASLELSKILFDDGDTQGSLDVLEDALSYKVDKTLLARASARRGELFDLTGRPKDAAREFAECFSASQDSALCEACNVNAQTAYLSCGDYRQADSIAQKLLSGKFAARARRMSLLTRARASRAQGKNQDALDFISRLGCGTEIDSLCCSASLEEGEIKEALTQFGGATVSYLRALTLPGPDSLHAAALMHLGDLCAKRTGEPDKALGYYSLLLDRYAGDETSSRALNEMARLYETKGEFARASDVYRKLAKDYPLGPYADEALERAESLDSLFPSKIGERELKKVTTLLLSAASGSAGGDTLLERAASLFAGQYHSFDEARIMLEQALAVATPDRRPVLLLRLSDVHSRLSKKLEFEGKTSEASAEKSAALKCLTNLISQYPDAPVADEAAFLLIRDRLEGLSSPEMERTAASLYTEFLGRYPETQRFADALLGRAEALTKLSRAPGDDSYNEALATYDKLVGEIPQSPLIAQAHYWKGRALAGAGNVDAAEQEFGIVLASYPASAVAADAAYELAECKLAKRQLDEAIALYESAYEKTRNRNLRERALARKGDCLLVQGKFDEAIHEYEYILERDPGGAFSDDLLVKEADAYLDRGMLKKASESFERLAARFPKSPLLSESLKRKAEAEAGAGDFKKARATYEQIVERFPESRSDTTVMIGLARASFEAGDYKSSLGAYEQVLRLDMSDGGRAEAARGQILSLARMGDDGKVQKRLSWYGKNFPGDTTLASEIDFERGLSLFDKNQFEAAYASLSQAQAKLPAQSRIRALITMGMCKLKLQDFPQASSHFEEALALGPADGTLAFTAYFKLGTSLYAQAKYDEASRAYLSAGAVSPDSSSRCEAWYNAGLCMERTENWTEAASVYEKVAAACKGKLSQDAVFKSGYAYLNAGQRPKALERLKAALESGADDEKPEIQYWIGETYAAMGEFERAASEFLKVPLVYGEGSLWAVTARYKAGLAFEETGNVEAAAKQYRLLLEREGENSEWGSMAKERLQKLSK